jgi:hypothetical protein
VKGNNIMKIVSKADYLLIDSVLIWCYDNRTAEPRIYPRWGILDTDGKELSSIIYNCVQNT